MTTLTTPPHAAASESVSTPVSAPFRPTPGAPKRIAYFVGRFPNTAHSYFHREVSELRRRGVAVDFASTLHPAEMIAPHAWAADAVAETRYLVPIPKRDLPGTLWSVLRAGPLGWFRVARSLLRAKDLSWKDRAKSLKYTLLAGRLLQLARRHGWQHVHSGFCNDTANIPLHAHLLAGLPYSVSLHGMLHTFGPNQHEKWSNARFATVLTNQFLADIRQALANHLPPRIEVAPMGIPLERFARSAPYAPWPGHGPVHIFNCGRIDPGKGLIDLFNALAAIRATGIDARLTIAGEPFPRIDWFLEQLETTLDQLHLRDVVTRVGKVSEEKVRDLLEQAHLFVLPSHHEGVPVAVMEAMAMQVPVVATAVGGVPELVRDTMDGVLVPPSQPDALAAAILDILRSPEKALHLSAHGRARVAQSFHVGRNAAVMASCLGYETEPPTIK